MKLYIKNLYGFKDGQKAYYRKQGVFGFDFVNDRKFASELTSQEAGKVLAHSEWYKNQYKAEEIGIELKHKTIRCLKCGKTIAVVYKDDNGKEYKFFEENLPTRFINDFGYESKSCKECLKAE